MNLREATADDWPAVAEFFMTTPLESGTAFVLDRRPDFGMLPGLRGSFRTFLAFQDGRIAGSVTALWRKARDGDRRIVVGEIIDFRVAPWARGGRAAFLLLGEIKHAFAAQRADWVVCLIGDQNRATVPLTARRAGFPQLAPLGSFASVHFLVWRVPLPFRSNGLTVRRAKAADAALISDLSAETLDRERFAPADPVGWPDANGKHRAWIASTADGLLCGMLLVWDGEPARRLRVLRYRTADLPVRWASRLGAWLGIAVPLPAAGGVLGLWASRVLIVRRGGSATLRALLDAALRDAADAGQCVVQLNLHGHDPLMNQLPAYPRSIYRSTLYGCPLLDEPDSPPSSTALYHADLARV